MLYQDLVSEIENLSLDKQVSLMEMLFKSIQRRTRPRRTVPAPDSLARVRGMLKPTGPLPSDVELANDYSAYLIQKYA